MAPNELPAVGRFSDALMLLDFVSVAMGIAIYQEYRTERVLVALHNLTSPCALVARNVYHSCLIM